MGKWLEKRSENIGEKLGDLTVTAVLTAPLYEFECECGERFSDRLDAVRRKRQQHCGCYGVRVGDTRDGLTIMARGQDRSSRIERSEFIAECLCGRVETISAKSWSAGRGVGHWCPESSGMLGKVYERLTVIEYIGKGRGGYRLWRCACVCGNHAEVVTSDLNRGNTRSCGCLHRDVTSERGRQRFPTVEIPGYPMAHRRVSDLRGKASTHDCVDCGRQADDWSYDGQDPLEITATTSFKGSIYSLDPNHYQPRCKPCHKSYDGRMKVARQAALAA